MTESSHIFTPTNSSLVARAAAYSRVFKAYMNAEASLKCMEDEEWVATLGERQDVEEAYQICVHSLEVAAKAFDKSEVEQALQNGLLNAQEAHELVYALRSGTMKRSRRQSARDQDANSTRFRR